MKLFRSAVLLALLLVGGCSQDPVPKVAPKESPSASVSESPSPSGPDGSSARTPKAFIRAYFAAVGDSTTSGATRAFLKMSAPECQNCRTLANNIEGAYEDSGHVEGGGWKVLRISSSATSSELGSVWNVDVKTSRERWYDGSDELIKIVRASTQHFGVLLSDSGERAIVRDLRLQQ